MVSLSITQPENQERNIPAGEAEAPTVSSRRARLALYSICDQALAVGGMFLANVALARVRSKEEYGAFALCYSVYTFLAGLHNALILEPFTVFGSGRYHAHFQSYTRLIRRSNLALCGGLSVLILAVWFMLRWIAPELALPVMLGMALACGSLLTGAFIRRTFYVERRPDRAARFSLSFFAALMLLLLLAIRLHWLSGFTTFAIAALAWSAAALLVRSGIPGRRDAEDFHNLEARYWTEHWKYARWVVATAFVFQLMTQGYYWLVAGFLSVRELAGLRAMHLLVTPVDQLFIALTLLILPVMARRHAAGQPRALMVLWAKYSLLFLGVTAAFAAMVRATSGPLLHLIYGGKFDELSHLLAVLVFIPLVLGVGNATNAALKAIERPSGVFWAYLASGLVTFSAGIPLVIHLGLRGAVYGMLLSAAAYTVTLLLLWTAFLRAGQRRPSGNGVGRLRIAIVEPVWTNYRHPVYRELAEHSAVDWIFSPASPAAGFGPVLSPGSANLRYIELPLRKPLGCRLGFRQRGVVRYLIAEKPDVVVISADPNYLSLWLTLAAGRILGIPIYAHGHGVFKKAQISWTYRRMMNLLLRLSHGYIAYAPVVRDAFAAHGFPTGKVHVVHNSVVNPCPVFPGEKTGAERGVLFLGRLRPGSGIEVLLDAVRRLREQDQLELEVHIVGDGEEAERLREQHTAADWVHWHGAVYDPLRIREISLQCFAGCHPGNAGLSIVQMMSLSLPVLIHDDQRCHGPESAFACHRVNGYFYGFNQTSDALRDALLHLTSDKQELLELQRGAWRGYRGLTSPSMASRLLKILLETKETNPRAVPEVAAEPAAALDPEL